MFTFREVMPPMNDLRFPSNQPNLVLSALDSLKTAAGIRGELVPAATQHADAVVLLEVGGRKLRYECEVKKKVDRHSLLLAMINQPSEHQNRLLVSSPLSLEMANRCRELNLQFIDTAGNAFLRDGEGIYIYIAGCRGTGESYLGTSSATVTPAALKMMFAFLANPSLLNAAYRDISQQAKVSTGAIGKVLDMLEERGFIGSTTGARRMIRSPELFLNEWASNYVSRLRPKLKKWHFETGDLDTFRNRWNPGFKISAWGGETAAALETNHLHPEEATIYINAQEPNALRDLVKDYRLSATPNGNIEIVEMFWSADYFTDWFPTVPPHLIYADLLATHDPRNIAVAQQLSSQVIEHVLDKSRKTG